VGAAPDDGAVLAVSVSQRVGHVPCPVTPSAQNTAIICGWRIEGAHRSRIAGFTF
jgi:hypothetical protein